MTDHLRLPMVEAHTLIGAIRTPRTWARLVLGTAVSRRLRALVDSGAYMTTVSYAVAHELGLSVEDLRALPTSEATGLGGATQPCHALRAELRIGPGGDDVLALPGARVFVVPRLTADYELLVGQRDALERLTFVQRNHGPRPEFVLQFPPER